jgi:DNA polymerase-1
MIYGTKWTDAAESDCEYFASYSKCNCSKHKEMRTNSKQISFGLIYGISAIGLSWRLKLPKAECQLLIDSFFEKFTKIKAMMNKFASYATKHARIIEPSLGRSRHYDKWKLTIDKERAGVERASMNFPIQGSGSSLLKLSLVLLRRWIQHNNLQEYVRILMPYHDEISIEARDPYVEAARVALEHNMMRSATLLGYDGLKAGAAVGDTWYDAH